MLFPDATLADQDWTKSVPDFIDPETLEPVRSIEGFRRYVEAKPGFTVAKFKNSAGFKNALRALNNGRLDEKEFGWLREV